MQSQPVIPCVRTMISAFSLWRNLRNQRMNSFFSIEDAHSCCVTHAACTYALMITVPSYYHMRALSASTWLFSKSVSMFPFDEFFNAVLVDFINYVLVLWVSCGSFLSIKDCVKLYVLNWNASLELRCRWKICPQSLLRHLEYSVYALLSDCVLHI